MTTSSAKMCVVCREDCSGQPRVKDSRNRYYCRGCYQHLQQKALDRSRQEAESDAWDPMQETRADDSTYSMHGQFGSSLMDDVVHGLDDLDESEAQSFVEHPAITNRASTSSDEQEDTTPLLWPIVIGNLGIIWATLVIIYQFLNLIFATRSGSELGITLWLSSSSIVALILAGMLLWGAAQLLLRRPAGVNLVQRWSVISIVLSLILLAGLGTLRVLIGTGALEDARYALGLQPLDEMTYHIALSMVFVFFNLALALFFLTWFRLDFVRSEILGWRLRPQGMPAGRAQSNTAVDLG